MRYIETDFQTPKQKKKEKKKGKLSEKQESVGEARKTNKL